MSIEECYICFGDKTEGKLISPCKCTGTLGFAHVECLKRWIRRNKGRCWCTTCLGEYINEDLNDVIVRQPVVKRVYFCCFPCFDATDGFQTEEGINDED